MYFRSCGLHGGGGASVTGAGRRCHRARCIGRSVSGPHSNNIVALYITYTILKGINMPLGDRQLYLVIVSYNTQASSNISLSWLPRALFGRKCTCPPNECIVEMMLPELKIHLPWALGNTICRGLTLLLTCPAAFTTCIHTPCSLRLELSSC